MKILQLCKKIPIPPKDGEGVAVLALANGYLAHGAAIDLLSFNTKKHLIEEHDFRNYKHSYNNIISVYLDNSINYFAAFVNLFGFKSYNIQRFINKDFEHKLLDKITSTRYDFIQLESLYMAPYLDIIKSNTDAIVVMRSHNLEYQIWQDMSIHSKNIFLKWYYSLCAKRLKNYELDCIDRFDLVMPISKEDYFTYQNILEEKKLLLIPVGIDLSKYKTTYSNNSNNLKIGYLGSLDWMPNIEGLLWFFKTVWPQVIAKSNNIEFHLAGRNPVQEIKEIKAQKYIFHGEIDSAKDFLSSLDIVIVPLFSGSGIRVKILESMAMSKPVISTPKGFEGITVKNGVEADIVTSAQDFVDQILMYNVNSSKIEMVGANAKAFIEKNFEEKALARRVLNKFESLLNKD